MEEEIIGTLIKSKYPFWIIVIIIITIQLLTVFFAELIKKRIEKKTISDITKQIKQVEKLFTTQTEQLKSQLSILTNVQTEISAIERNVIIDFNKQLFSFIHLIIAGIDNCINNEALDLYAKKLNDFSIQSANSLPLFTLFIENKKLCHDANILLNLALQMETERHLDLIKLKTINTEIKSINDPILRKKKEKERFLFIDEMSAKPTQIYESNKSLIFNFQKDCREYIHRLLKKSEE